jgi:hypothetical protein
LIITGTPFAKPASSSSGVGGCNGALAITIPMQVTFGTRGASSTLYIVNTVNALIQISEATANKYFDFTITYQV